MERNDLDAHMRERLAMVGKPLHPGRNPLKFTFDGKAVMLGNRCICVTTSGTLARRISNALNHYRPNERGY